jgi:hypothetical protein
LQTGSFIRTAGGAEASAKVFFRRCPQRHSPFVMRVQVRHQHQPRNPKIMNTKIISFYATLLLAASGWLKAGEPGQPKPTSPEFERLKTLVGTWTGKTDMGQGPVDLTIQYRLVAGGTVLEERSAPGTPMEMVTMFYDKAGKLALTHYCVLGNRPEMALKTSDAKSVTFDFDSCCAIDPKKESHMHGMTIQFDDADTMTTLCQAVIDGKEVPAHTATFKRVKTETTAAQ